MERSFLQRLLKPLVELRSQETTTALLMFAFSFLAMTAHNIFKPVSKSKYIESLGADNLPWVILGASVVIGILMTGYARLMAILPRRYAIAIMQAGMSAALVGLWFGFKTGQRWVPVVAYLVYLVMGVLLISQFWTFANLVYDPRQAKRLFGFIGGGAPLGGVAASALVSGYTQQIGTTNFVLVSAGVLAVCAVLVLIVAGREDARAASHADAGTSSKTAAREESIGWTEALQMLRRSKHLQIIALIIGFAAIGGSIIDQQLSMAAQASKGQTATDAITTFLGQVQLWMSAISFVIQVWLTSSIHRFMGIGAALLVLPLSLGATGALMLLNAALWTPALARIADQSLRYTVDKTSREILFLPLPDDLKLKAKTFVDVTVDRFAKGVGAAIALMLIKPWGLGWGVAGWQKLSYASLAITVAWIFMTTVARRGYLAAFRTSIERRDLKPAALRLDVADLSTVETLMEELASPDEHRVLYAIEILEALEKRNLITPLLLHHQSPAVRARALQAMGAAAPEIAERWLPAIQRMIADEHADVRAAAIAALANIRNEEVADLVRPYLADPEPRLATTAAVVLARSRRSEDVDASEALLSRLASDSREAAAAGRKDVAAAIRQIPDPRFRSLLIPLLYDSNTDVAAEAIRSVRTAGVSDQLFVPTLASLLRHQVLKGAARETLVGYGDAVVGTLGYLLRDPDEDVWVRRRIPAVLARIPGQPSVDILIGALEDPDGLLRFEAIDALGKLRRDGPDLAFARPPIEALALKEGLRYFTAFTLRANLDRGNVPRQALLGAALDEKMARASDRIYRLLGLLYAPKDIAAARYAIERGEVRSRASALEYLDNLLSGPLRKRLMPIVEDLPADERVRRANLLLKTRPRDLEETLLQLIHDDDPVVAAAALDLSEELRIWTLAGDIEYVLVHRDPKDWFVFEAASWTLAAHRMPQGRRRDTWVEPLPIVQLAARLRRDPFFASVSIDELFRIAASGRQLRYESGKTLMQEGLVPEQVQFLLDGKVSASAERQPPSVIAPPAALGFEDSLQGRASRETIRTEETTVCLALDRNDLRALLSENTALVQGLFRTLTGHRRDPIAARAAGPSALRPHAGPLKPVEKILALQRVPIFAGVSADEMRHLGAIAREIPLEAGAALFADSDAPALWVVIAGQVVLQPASDAPPLCANAGDMVGAYATLAGSPIGRSAVAAEAGRALRIDRDELFDLFAQHPRLLQQMFSGLFPSRPLSGKAAAADKTVVELTPSAVSPL